MEDHNITIHKFNFYHNGGNILVTDVIGDHNEVKEEFLKDNENKYFSSNYLIKDIEIGNYDVYILESDMDKWGKRVLGLYFLNSKYDHNEIMSNNNNWKELFDFGVDGGTCMFLSQSTLDHKVDLDVFLEKWMSCQYEGNYLKLDINRNTIGFSTMTGYGDGLYYFFGYFLDNKLIGVKVFFIDDEDTYSE